MSYICERTINDTLGTTGSSIVKIKMMDNTITNEEGI